MSSYPNRDIQRDARKEPRGRGGACDSRDDAPRGGGPARRALPCRAKISEVEEGSPAFDAGFEPGCFLTAVDGHPLRDVVDWRWYSAGDEMELSYIDLDGEAGEVELWREPGQDWGFRFEGLVFDGVKQCRNACTFCFMRQLPDGMRDSLYLRDDDFRLSFLVGTFVTLTNLSADDEQRIIEQRISPLRVSLQAAGADVRRALMGKHAAHGLAALERLLAAGIEFHAQVVLVPDGNDGDALAETLSWAYERPGILDIGIVPLGYTRHQGFFARSFNDPLDAAGVLELIAPFQERARAERGHAWVHAADEFYRNAYGPALLENLPPTSHYGDFAMFEDGIGIIRSVVDDWEACEASGAIESCRRALSEAGRRAVLVAGEAQRAFLDVLVARSGLADAFSVLYVRNDFFGGNVDVTGLLVGKDIASAVKGRAGGAGCGAALYCVPEVVFNDDGVTLDDMTLADMEKAAGVALHVVSCSPSEYLEQIAGLARP